MDKVDRGQFLRMTGLGALGLAAVGPTAVALAPTPTSGAVTDVKTLGAVGDGIHDDTDAIQAAIRDATQLVDAQNKAVGGCVFFPPGQYRVTQPLYIAGKRYLRMMGPGTIKAEGSASPVLSIGASSAALSHCIDISQLNFTTTDSGMEGIRMNGAVYVRVHECTFTGFKTSVNVMYHKHNHELYFLNNEIEAIEYQKDSVGISLASPDNVISNNLIRGTCTGIFVGAHCQSIAGNHIYRLPGILDHGIILGGTPDTLAEGILIQGNYFDNAAEGSVRIRADLTNVAIQNNYFHCSIPKTGSTTDGAPFIVFHKLDESTRVRLNCILVQGNMFRCLLRKIISQPIVFMDGIKQTDFKQTSVKGNTFFSAKPFGFESADFV